MLFMTSIKIFTRYFNSPPKISQPTKRLSLISINLLRSLVYFTALKWFVYLKSVFQSSKFEHKTSLIRNHSINVLASGQSADPFKTQIIFAKE